MTLSAPVKIFALVAMLGALVFGGAMMFMTPGADLDEASAATPLPTKSQGVLAAPKAAKKAAGKADAAAKQKVAAGGTEDAVPAAAAPGSAAAAPAPAPAAKPAAKPAAAPTVAANGLPSLLAQALGRNDVVVVALWGTGGKIDEMSRDEAAAGAAAAGAGFLPLNLIDQSKQAEALTLKLGFVLRAPGVLVYTRPDVLANRLDGFRDRDTVAQAVIDSLR